MTRRTATLIAAVLCAFAAGALVAQAVTPVTAKREALAAADDPIGAKGDTLGLSRVSVPAGANLALHHHSGTQVAFIEEGTLSYTVKSGSVTVRTGDADERPTVVRKISAGQTGKIRAGSWIVEQPTTIHRAANQTKQPITIYLATLFPEGSPPSVPNPE